MQKTSESREESDPAPQPDQEQLERDSGEENAREHPSFIQGAGTG